MGMLGGLDGILGNHGKPDGHDGKHGHAEGSSRCKQQQQGCEDGQGGGNDPAQMFAQVMQQEMKG